ncbi:alpha/beta-hydrolase [Rickenella mellea]|uniref:Alpha/beta-hydrolase n=1 Tax=Rickenella mellea TaxID=50990 RepID=A0A4Y7PVR7_9AGAM|nr:alpha/beta-hydrolase [Rickenella mellea]
MSPQNTSYLRPDEPRSFASVNPRSLLAFVEPPKHLTLYPPSPPVHARGTRTIKSLDNNMDEWEVTTHVIPAAYPRGTPLVRLSSRHAQATEPLTKEARAKQMEQTALDLIEFKHRSVRGEDCGGSMEEEPSRVLWNVVNRYVKLGKSRNIRRGTKDITLLLTHPTGFPKEIWEPFIQQLTHALLPSDVCVAEIWSLEAVQHGDAALLNEGHLGDLYDWADNSRDILNFLLNYLPDIRDPHLSSSNSSRCPAHLPRLSDEVVSKRRSGGFDDRILVAIGHSFGGCTATLAALTHPSLFSSLILVDPVITAPWIVRATHLKTMVLGAIRRRAVWDSREEARRLFAANPFFAAWDPKVLDTYVEHGLVQDVANEKFVLKTPARQEGVCFTEVRVGCEVFELLPTLDPRIEVRWILAGKDLEMSVTGDVQTTAELVWRRPMNASNVRIGSSGHLVAQEAPAELARDVCDFMTRKYKDANGKARL